MTKQYNDALISFTHETGRTKHTFRQRRRWANRFYLFIFIYSELSGRLCFITQMGRIFTFIQTIPSEKKRHAALARPKHKKPTCGDRISATALTQMLFFFMHLIFIFFYHIPPNDFAVFVPGLFKTFSYSYLESTFVKLCCVDFLYKEKHKSVWQSGERFCLMINKELTGKRKKEDFGAVLRY